MDLVLIRGNKIVVGIEIKYSNSPKLSRGTHEVFTDLDIPEVLVLTPSSDEYKMYDKITVVPLDRLRFHLKRLKLLSIHQE